MQQGLTATCKDCGSELRQSETEDLGSPHESIVAMRTRQRGSKAWLTRLPKRQHLEGAKGLSDMTDRCVHPMPDTAPGKLGMAHVLRTMQ
jgi:hypothetical protein